MEFYGIDMSGAIDGAYVTVASHATTSAIWAAAGNAINFTGSETITNFPAAGRAGATRYLICAGACVFTHAGNITVQGGVTYTAAVGEVVTVIAKSTTTFHVVPPGIATVAQMSNLKTLTDNSIADALHRHSELVASDGSPDPALSVDATGKVSFPAGTGINEFSIDGAMSGNSDDAVPTEKAVKTYAGAAVGASHTQNTDTALGSGAVAADHGTPATDQVVNVCYGTGSAPTANTTTIGTLFVKYIA